MKNMKKWVMLLVIIGILGTAVAAFAATGTTPAEIAAQLTGKSVEDIYDLRAEGKTFGQIAADQGKLEQFKALMLEVKKANLDQRVKDGKLTQDQADAIYERMVENQANCDGTGSGQGNCGMGGFGKGNGRGRGGMGGGRCNGAGMGAGCGR